MALVAIIWPGAGQVEKAAGRVTGWNSSRGPEAGIVRGRSAARWPPRGTNSSGAEAVSHVLLLRLGKLHSPAVVHESSPMFTLIQPRCLPSAHGTGRAETDG
jgi:hypothetical protein